MKYKQYASMACFLWLMALVSCGPSSEKKAENASESTLADRFRDTLDGKEVNLYTLKNTQGATVTLTNFGARLVSLSVPDKSGKLTDVVLGFNTAAEYHNPEEPFFGTIVGPYGNRIANGRLELDGNIYTLAVNNGPNTLHGGFKGVHFAVWDVLSHDHNSVEFHYVLPDEHEGFPGNIDMKVTYHFDDNNELTISYEASTDKKTVINLTNHAYFNMNGEGSGTILNHLLTLYADRYTPVDETLIPTGEIPSVSDTPFDFLKAKAIGKDIDADNEQLRRGKGYDHNFVLNATKVDGLNHAATVVGDKSGIKMDIYTSEPGIQFYSGNFMSEKVILKDGSKDSFRTGFCLEPQHFPDAPNQPSFPSTVLNPGEIYTSKSMYKFGVNQ